jgi:hypothetical protein
VIEGKEPGEKYTTGDYTSDEKQAAKSTIEDFTRNIQRKKEKELAALQAGSEDDTAQLPPVPFQRSAAVAERDGLQPGESLAAAGVAKEDRQLVVDEPAAAIGQDRGADQARRYYWLMLAESHLTRRLFGAMVRRIAALPVATGSRRAVGCREIRRPGGEAGEVFVEITEKRLFPGFVFPGGAKLELGGAERRPGEETALRSIKTRRV